METTQAVNPIEYVYLLAGVLFIVGLRLLGSPKTARLGNRISALGMLGAVAGVLTQGVVSWWVIITGIVIGAVIGVWGARAVKMTAMPQMVAIFNGCGGGAAALVATGELLRHLAAGETLTIDQSVTTVLSAVIGAISFSGSIIAYLKLQELMTGRPITYLGQQVVNALILLTIIAAGGFVIAGHDPTLWLYVALGASFALGILFTLPIGGADMPVIISLLNSFTGLAAAMTGFVLSNNVLIISGALVGASGTLLTILMGKAMNRSITNVLFGAFGAAPSGGASTSTSGGTVRSVGADDVATMLAYANQVIVVPGYGMAVSQAQHAVRELAENLEKRGVEVKYAIHPVAGRMPGHMNVLLAEANVPYDALYDMEDIANDVTNPAARTDKNSPIYGMPILDVDRSNNIVVLKRSMNAGFAGIDNPLYGDPKTVMLFGDAKKSIEGVNTAVKAL
jgi:NAD(P) transhydrogenase subunit beta